MGEPSFLHLAVLVLFSSLMLVLGLYLLAKFNRLFRRTIPNELLRKNVVVWMIAVCLILALSPTSPEFHNARGAYKLLGYFLKQIIYVTVEVIIVFNTGWVVRREVWKRYASFNTRMGLILLTIILGCIFSGVLLNLVTNK